MVHRHAFEKDYQDDTKYFKRCKAFNKHKIKSNEFFTKKYPFIDMKGLQNSKTDYPLRSLSGL
jgi:hypothetical protein